MYEMSSGYLVIDERIRLARSDYQNIEDSDVRRVTRFIFDMANKKNSCRELMLEVKYLLIYLYIGLYIYIDEEVCEGSVRVSGRCLFFLNVKKCYVYATIKMSLYFLHSLEKW